MSYVDAHIHLADPGYKGQIEEILQDANQNLVAHLLSNAIDLATSLETISLAKEHQGLVAAAIGVHPFTIVNKGEADRERFDGLLNEHKELVSAIGEIGLDGKYTQDPDKVKLQREDFRFFLSVAEKRRLPVVVHSRSAVREVLDDLSGFDLPRVLLHWYDGPTENLKMIHDRGWMISIGPAVLYSRRIAQIAHAADMTLILTETDGPVRFHGPFEGKPTRPSFVINVIRKLAELKSKDSRDIQEEIGRNFRRLMQS